MSLTLSDTGLYCWQETELRHIHTGENADSLDLWHSKNKARMWPLRNFWKLKKNTHHLYFIILKAICISEVIYVYNHTNNFWNVERALHWKSKLKGREYLASCNYYQQLPFSDGCRREGKKTAAQACTKNCGQPRNTESRGKRLSQGRAHRWAMQCQTVNPENTHTHTYTHTHTLNTKGQDRTRTRKWKQRNYLWRTAGPLGRGAGANEPSTLDTSVKMS